MEVGSVSGGSATLQNSQAQPSQNQEIRQQDQAQRQAELETAPQPAEQNTPTPDSRVGSVINTQA